jgi:nucleoid-associated protein YgaU
MNMTLAIRIGAVSLVAAGVVSAFIFQKKLAPAPSHSSSGSTVTGDRIADTDRRNAPGNSLENRASAAVETAAEALKAILGDQAVRPTDPSDQSPSFDVARIESTGEAVIAGRATPGATVELLRAGEVYEQTLANEAGEFVLVPRPLPPGNYELTLRSTLQNGQKLTSKRSVAVALGSRKDTRPEIAAVAPRKDGLPAVTRVDPRKDDRPMVAAIGAAKDDRAGGVPTGPAKVDQPAAAPAVPENPVRAPAKPAGAAVGLLVIDTVDPKPDGKLYIAARTAPDGAVKLYLNDAYIASATPSAEGRVTFVIQGGVTPGDYRIRLDKLDPSGGVQSRAESSLKVPAATFETASARSTPAFRPGSQARPPLSAEPTASDSEMTANRAPRADEPALPRRADASQVSENRAPRADDPALPRPAGPSGVTENGRSRTDEPVLPQPAGASEIAENRQSRADQPALPGPAGSSGVTENRPSRTDEPVLPRPSGASNVAESKASRADDPALPRPAGPSGATENKPPRSDEPALPRPPLAAGPTLQTAAAAAPGENAGVVVVPKIETTVVAQGDNLWRISRTTYGRGVRYPMIVDANRDQIRNPNLIYPGQVFVLPNAPDDEAHSRGRPLNP